MRYQASKITLYKKTNEQILETLVFNFFLCFAKISHWEVDMFFFQFSVDLCIQSVDSRRKEGKLHVFNATQF